MSNFITKNAVVIDWCYIPDERIQELIRKQGMRTERFNKHSVMDLSLLWEYYHPEYDGPPIEEVEGFDGEMLRYLKSLEIDVVATPVFIHIWW